MKNPFTHIEILGKNGKALEKFYAKAFGWKFKKMQGMDYFLFGGRGEGSGGAVGVTMGKEKRSVVPYIGVTSMTQAIARLKKAGGKLVSPPSTIPGIVTWAIFQDPAGNQIGLAKSGGRR